MEDLSIEAYLHDPIMVIAHSLIGPAKNGVDLTDISFQELDVVETENGAVVNALVRNIQLFSSLSNGQNVNEHDAVRSGLPKMCENLRVHFAEVIYKQIVTEVESRETKGSKNADGPNEELLLLLYLTTICTSTVIYFEHNTLTKSTKLTSSALSHENLAALNSVLFILLGFCTNVTKNHTEMMQTNEQERMLLLRESVKSLPKTGGKVSIIEEVPVGSNNADYGGFMELSMQSLVPPPYRTPYISTSLLHTIPNTSSNTTLHSIVRTTIAQFTQLCTTISTNSARRSTKSKSGAGVDSVVREDRAAVLTQSIINVARCWNATSSSVVSDRLAANSMLCLIDPVYHASTSSTSTTTTGITTNVSTSTTTTLSSAAFTALVPIAMRLLDRYEPTLHTLALVLLYTAADATPPGLLCTFLDWILPHLYSYIEIVSDDWSRLMAARVIHSLLCSDVHSSISLQHAHLYVESSIRQLQLKPSVAFAWPYLYHMQRMYTFLPVGVLAIHCSSVVDCYLHLLNVWHLPLQNLVLESIAALVKKLNSRIAGLDALVPKIATELIRLNIFYHSPQNDISGASATDISAIIHNSVVLGRQLRGVNNVAWDTFVSSVLSSVVGLKGTDTGSTVSSARTAGADEHVVSVLEKFLSDCQECK